MLTEHDFFAPAMCLAGLQSEHAPSFAYLFTWPSPVMGGAFGSIHGIDLPFFWGLRNDPGLEPLIGDLAAAEPLSAVVQDTLLAFMRTGDRRVCLAALRTGTPRDVDLRSGERGRGRSA